MSNEREETNSEERQSHVPTVTEFCRHYGNARDKELWEQEKISGAEYVRRQRDREYDLGLTHTALMLM